MIKVRIDSSKLNTKARKEKAELAAAHLEVILNSEEFKNMILDMHPRWKRGSTGPFKHKSNREIYEAIIRGKETFWNRKGDNVLDIFIDDYYRPWSKVVGYIIPGKKTIFVNTKFFDSNSVMLVCSNFCHEMFHHLGMLHGGKYFKESIPYYGNIIINNLYPKLIKQGVDYRPRKTRYFRWWNPFSWF